MAGWSSRSRRRSFASSGSRCSDGSRSHSRSESGLAAVLFLWLSRRLTEPIRALTRATEDVAAGRYDVEIPEARGHDEIALLSDRFRGMVAQLAEAEQLKRSFLMSVSHELRTPLTAIRGHVEAVREGIVREPDQVRASLDIVAAETDRLERLVGDVLDLAKLQAHRFTVRHEEVDLERVLDHAYRAFAEEARRREIDYALSGAEAAPVIVSDGDRVLQVITNLLSNAFRWTPDGGRIELRLVEANGVVSVDVVDSGPGIPTAQRTRIFEAFVSQDAEGTGLGLPIARELAIALGGEIELGSNPGTGSRFRLGPADRAGALGLRRSRVREFSLRRVWLGDRLDDMLLRDGLRVLEPRESRIDSAPARAHEIDEKCEIVDAGVALREKVALDSLEPPDRLVEEAADLGDMACHRQHFGSHAVSHR